MNERSESDVELRWDNPTADRATKLEAAGDEGEHIRELSAERAGRARVLPTDSGQGVRFESQVAQVGLIILPFSKGRRAALISNSPSSRSGALPGTKPDHGREPTAEEAGPNGDMIIEICALWADGTGHAIKVARALSRFRRQLRYGQWAKTLKSFPFAKRTANMLVTIGSRLSWLDGQTFAHLPAGWSILYELAHLEQTAFEKLLETRRVHPRLTLEEARALVAELQGNPRKSSGSSIRRRLERFARALLKALASDPAGRAFARTELLQLIDRIDSEFPTSGDDHHADRDPSAGRYERACGVGQSLSHNIQPELPASNHCDLSTAKWLI